MIISIIKRVTLRALLALSKPAASLKEKDLINSQEKLYSAFNSFKQKILKFGIDNDSFLVTSRYCENPSEVAYYVMFKDRSDGKDLYMEGKAAIFLVEVDLETGFTSVRYGFGGHGAGKCIRISENKVEINKEDFINALELEKSFQDFLKLSLPEVRKWNQNQ